MEQDAPLQPTDPAVTGAPGAEAPPADALPETEAPPEEPEELPAEKVDNNVKYIIKLLQNAFIFNKNDYPDQLDIINKKIADIKNSTSAPVATVINKVKDVLSINPNLKVERRKTLKYINTLLEQLADATDLQAGDEKEKTPEPNTSDEKPAPKGRPINDLELREIFPLYRDLIVQALDYAPSIGDLNVIQSLIEELGDKDPMQIKDTIDKLLNPEIGDSNVENMLADQPD